MELVIVVAAVVLLCAFFIGWPAVVRYRRQTDPSYTPPTVIGVLDEPDLAGGRVTIDLSDKQS